MKQLKSIGALSQAMRSIAVVIVGIFSIAIAHSAKGQQPAQPSIAKCNCVFTDECGKGEYCGKSACEGSNDPLKPITGFCTLVNAPGSLTISAQALGAILLAYETAGAQGGPVNSSLFAELKRLGLSQSQQENLHGVALTLMSMYIGSDDAKVPFRRGYLIAPRTTEKCDGVCLGSVVPFQKYLMKAAPSIREAIVAELLKPSQRTLERNLRRVFAQTPRFLTFGRCESPYPVIDVYPRYRDGMTCLTAEIGNVLTVLRNSAAKAK